MITKIEKLIVDWLKSDNENATYLASLIEKLITPEQKKEKRKIFRNFITWYNAKPRVEKDKNSCLITTTIIEEYLNPLKHKK